jgi:transglutaminase-like putative cysteine protease
MKAIACIPCFFVLLVSTLSVFAQPKYPVSNIPPALLKDAHAVLRTEEINIELVNASEVVRKRKFALTILDEAGQSQAKMVVGYDRLRKVTLLEGTLYDATGRQVKKLKGKEVNDYSATSDISLYEDNRIKVHDFEYKDFPYTVEYEVELRYNHSYFFGVWVPQSDEHLAVEHSSYTIVAPSAYTPRYRAFNYKPEPAITTVNDKKTLKWEVRNLAVVLRPFASPLWQELTPVVYVGPTEFQMGEYKGNASTWQEFGKFQLLLNAGRDKLPPAITQKVVQLTQDVTEPKEKVKRLYEYLQQNTRYISVQLGIGGLQPFEAEYVAQKGYGDCKALSNYMYSLLKAAGIQSHYAWINGGGGSDNRFLMDDFPFDYFNHIVLCVPFAKDTMWLECTSQTEPAGYMGSFTGNRKALLITEAGGVLVPTPRYTVSTNFQKRIIKGRVDSDGNLTLNIGTKYAAEQQEYYSGMIHALSTDKVKKMLNERLDLSTYEIMDFSYAAKKAVIPEIDETLKIDVANYATVSGRRLFLLPNIMNRSHTRHTPLPERTADYVFDDPYTDVDSAEIVLPEGYSLEAMLPETNIKTAYGTYCASVKMEGAKVIYYRKMERFSGRFPAKDASLIAAFFETVYKADRSRVVLVRKEEATKPGM